MTIHKSFNRKCQLERGGRKLDFNDPIFIGSFVLQLGILVGIVFRVLLPYVQKKATDTTEKFDYRYLWSGILSFMLIEIEVFGFIAQPDSPIYNLVPQQLLFLGFMMGLGNTELSSRVLVGGASAVSAIRERQAEEKPKLNVDVIREQLKSIEKTLDDVSKQEVQKQ